MHNPLNYILLDAACPTVKTLLPKPTIGETHVRSMHACFPLAHPNTKTLTGLSVDLPSNGSIRKFSGTSFLAETPVPKYVEKNILNQIVSVLETRELFTMNCMLPKEVQACLVTNRASLVSWK